MAAITAAVIAIGAAVASTGAVAAGIATVATIGTIAAVVGGVGLALGAVGMITGNKTLTKIGTYLGAAAAGGGLGALAAQGLGLGASTAASGAGQAASGAGAAAEGAKDTAISGSSLVNSEVGKGVVGGLQQGATTIPDAITGTATQAASSGVSPGVQATSGAASLVSQSVPSGMTPPPTDMTPSTPIVNAPPTPIAGTQAPTAGTTAPPPPTTAGAGYGPMYGLMGAQMLGSTMSGVFQGQNAGNQMDMQERIANKQADQNQQQIDLAKQQQNWFQKNAAYAPVVSFKRPGGLLGTAMGRA